MIYLKVLDADGKLSSVEAIETPVYVKYQSRNKLLLQCPALHAQGILSANNAVAYLLEGKDPIPGLTHTAYIIGVAEYEQLKDTEEDHAHWLEQQLRLIDMIGLPNYLQSQMAEVSPDIV